MTGWVGRHFSRRHAGELRTRRTPWWPLGGLLLAWLALLGCSSRPGPAGKSEPESPPAAVASQPAPRESEQSVVARLQTEEELGTEPLPDRGDWVRAVRAVCARGGTFTYDASGNVCGVDLAADRLHRVLPTDEDVATLPTLAHLKTLRLYGDGITNQSILALNRCRGLTELALQSTRIDDAGFRQLTGPAGLERLDVSGSLHLTDLAWEHANHFTALTHLAVRDTGLTGTGLARIARLGSLRALDVRGCAEIATDHYDALLSLPNLTALKVAGAQVQDELMTCLGQLAPLRDLSIEDAAITDEGLQALRPLQLETLAVARCLRVTDAGLADLLTTQPLKRLELHDLTIAGTALAAVADRPGLQRLKLGKLILDNEALTHLRQLGALRQLDLGQTLLDDSWGPGLGGLVELELLDLHDTGLSDAVLPYLGQLTRLRSLILAGNGTISDNGLEPLATLPALQQLDLRRTAVTAAGVAAWRQRRPACHVEL